MKVYTKKGSTKNAEPQSVTEEHKIGLLKSAPLLLKKSLKLVGVMSDVGFVTDLKYLWGFLSTMSLLLWNWG